MISLDTIENSRNILILDGIAGSGKTSQTVAALQHAKVPYLHTTSTNALKRSIEGRFRHPAQTIASALFQTVDGRFYDQERQIDDSAVIIDEILQADPRTFQWVKDNRDKKIIICTDSRQMLAPGISGRVSLNCLNSLKSSEDVTVVSIPDTLRPVDNDTQKMYQEFYQMDSDKAGILPDFPHIKWENLEYSHDAYYMCHSNQYEKQLYSRFKLYADYSDVTPKAFAPLKISHNVPILCQMDAIAMNSRKYYQIGNVGSVYRFQGREVLPGHPIYYLISPDDKVGVRELYTMITRAKSVHDIVIVDMERKDAKGPSVYYGNIVKTKPLFVRECSPDNVDKMLYDANARADGKVVYTEVISNGKRVMPPRISGMSASAIVRREPQLALDNPGDLYDACAAAGYPVFQTPTNMDTQRDAYSGFKYGIDLYSAYPHSWAFCPVPDGTSFRPDNSGEIGVYITTSDKYGSSGKLITGPLYDYMVSHDSEFSAALIGSYCSFDDHVGEDLLKLAYDTVESKDKLHSIHYGFYQKKYYQPVYRGMDIIGYTVNDKARYELLMTAIQSELCLTMARLKVFIFGSVERGRTRTDCLYFDSIPSCDIAGFGNALKEIIPGYDFRIFDNSAEGRTAEKPVLYKSYKELLTAKEKKSAKERMRRLGGKA